MNQPHPLARALVAGTLLLLAVALLWRSAPLAAQACSEGRVASAVTGGRCCWPGQSWSRSTGSCDGRPTCPPGLVREATSCVPAPMPQCAEGRLATVESSGRCCWPQQTWNLAAGLCEGPPRCPAPLVEEGDDCIAPGELPLSATPASSLTGREPAQTSTPRIATATTAAVDTHSIVWLQATGIVTWGAVWLFGFVVPAAFGVPGGEVGILAIPFAGPWMCIAGSCRRPGDFVAGLVTDGVLQITGLVLFILGTALQTEAAPTDLAILPWLSPDVSGATLSASF